MSGSMSSAERQGAAKGSSSAGVILAGRWVAVRVEWSGRFSSSRQTSGCLGLRSVWAVAAAPRAPAAGGGLSHGDGTPARYGGGDRAGKFH